MSGGKEAFLQMVHLMVGTENNHQRTELSNHELPHCLKKQLATSQDTQLRKWPCLVCAKLFSSLDKLVHHSSNHTFENQTVGHFATNIRLL